MRPTTVWGELWKNKHRMDGGCSHCGAKRDRSNKRYCRACRALYAKKRRALGRYP